jgi:hypothetical protein
VALRLADAARNLCGYLVGFALELITRGAGHKLRLYDMTLSRAGQQPPGGAVAERALE